MERTKLDWSTAEVHGGILAVALDGKPPKEWIARFESTVQLLNHGSWEKVELKKREISVKTITVGEEDRVRHFLESAVLEANGAVASDESDTDLDDAGGDDDDAASRQDGPDTEMTKRFRAFASIDSESSRAQES
jgi:hypothetical protein